MFTLYTKLAFIENNDKILSKVGGIRKKLGKYLSKYKNYFKSGFSNFSKIISLEIREKYYFEFLEKLSRRTQSDTV
jgi:hypothetical protein